MMAYINMIAYHLYFQQEMKKRKAHTKSYPFCLIPILGIPRAFVVSGNLILHSLGIKTSYYAMILLPLLMLHFNVGDRTKEPLVLPVGFFFLIFYILCNIFENLLSNI